MTVNLKKGQVVGLRREENDLSRVTIGLGWDSMEGGRASFDDSGDGSSPDLDLDLDVVAFLCNDEGKVVELGRDANGKVTLVDSDVIFFGNPEHRSGKVWLTGDNLTGDGEGDDEQIVVDLNGLPRDFGKVLLVVQVYKGIEKNQSFAGLRNAFIRAVDRRGSEVVRFGLCGDEGSENCRSMLFAEISRDGGDWRFHALGEGFETDSFLELLKRFM